MNILMLHPHDVYSNSEPWTVRITYLATEFVKRGHHVRMIYHLIDPRISLEEATERQEFPFTTIPAYRYQFALMAKMRSTVEFARWADVIHFQKCFPHVSVPAIWSAYRLGKPVHYDWDDWEYGIFNYQPGPRIIGWSINAFERLLPKLVDTVSVASDALREQAIDCGVPSHRIFEAHVGADLERFRPDIDPTRVRQLHHIDGPLVLYLGQLHGAQYLELFLQSAKALIERGSDATFMVVGGGERFGELFQLTEQLRIGHRVVFTGAVDHAEIPEYIAAADVAVACFEDTEQTRTKSPLKICEYMAAGAAVVASHMGEVPNMIGDAGVLVEPGNAEQLADGIAKLLADPELGRELGRKARRRAEMKYNWGVTAENLLLAYEMAMHKRRWLFWDMPPQKKNFERYPLTAAPSLASITTLSTPPETRVEIPPYDEMPGEDNAPPREGALVSLSGWAGQLTGFVQANLDIIGVLDGRESYVGPHTIQIDPTNLCNNDCLACWCRSPLLLDKALPSPKRDAVLPLPIVLRLLDDMVRMGSREVYVAGGGEPFCHPNIREIISEIKKRGLVCNINTNFTLIDQEMVEFLSEQGVDYMTVSVWAGTPETYSLLHPNKTEETFHQIKEMLAKLNAIKRHVPFIKVYNVINNLNFHEIKAMVDFALKTRSESVEFTVLDTIPDRTDALLLDEEQREWLYAEACRIREWIEGEVPPRLHLFKYDQFLRRISGEHTTTGEHDKTIIDSMPCTVGWQFARIMADGDVNQCLKAHRIPSGNLHHDRFLDLWTGRAQHDWRQRTNVLVKQDPWFANIGNDPSARVGCYKSCDDLGRIEHLVERYLAMTPLQQAVLKGAALWLRVRRKYLRAEWS
ncbi:MAG: glycosyltransferase [Candidatus Lernaella stagnicola]|nr:glycosyltransferase [Candidatus Lernaella stagnicola]